MEGTHVRRTSIALALSMGLILASVGAAAAATPSKDCPTGPAAGPWQSYAINLTWVPGDPIPGAGDQWWALTLQGIAAEQSTPEDVAADFGFASVDELYESVVLGIRGLDKNGDGRVCAKPYKVAFRLPAYFFNAVDNNARQH